MFHQVKNTLDLLLTKYLKAVISYEGIVRVETFPVPRAALNALVHLDYAVTAPVQIRVYEDCLRMWNPAVLPEGWTMDTLLGAHASSPYNPALANAFFRAGEIEAWGRGVERIFAACRTAGVSEPVLRYEPNDMCLEFMFDAAYLKVLRAGQKQNPQVTEQVTEQVERLIAALNNQTLSLQELMLLLGLLHRPNFMALYLRPALDAKYLQMTVPDKPNSRLQKYKLTVLGRQWLTHRNKA